MTGLALPRSQFALFATCLFSAIPAAHSQVTLNDAGDYSTDITGSQSVSVTGGTNTLSGTNTYTGTTSISGGTLTLSGGSAIGDTSAVTLANTAGVQLTLNANETIGSLAGGGTTGGDVVLGDFFLTVGGDDTDTEFFGDLTGNNGGLIKTGSGTFTLSSSNTNWNGDTTINGGTLRATAFSVPWGSDLILANTAGVTFEIAYAGVERLAGLSGGGTTGGTVSLISGSTLQAGFGNATSQFDGIITGAGALDKIGSGTLTLGGANTFTGDTTITAGTLKLAHSDALQSSTLTTATGLDFGTLTSATLGGLSGSDDLALINTDSTPAAVTLTVGGNDADTSYSGVLSGAGSLTKTGTGNLTLSSTNTFTGGTTINAGTLTLGHATDTLANADTVNIAGGILALGSNADTVGTVNLSSGSITGSGTLTGSAYNLTDTGAIAANLSGSAALIKSGAGTATLSGANTYSGGTTINAGTLAVSGGSAIADDNAVSIASGAVFDLNDTTEIVGSISGAGSIDLGSGTLTAGGNNSSTAFSGVISGTDGSLIKQGSGTLTLSGTNTFTGGTTISAGTLAADNDALPGTTTLAGGTLSTAAFDAANLTPTSGTLAASGSLTNVPTISANFTVDLTPGGSFGDSTTLDGGTAKVGSFNLATGNLTFTSGTLDTSGTLTIGSDNSSTSLSGSIAGSGSLTKSGTGNLTLSGTNTYSGGTTINAGILTLGHATDTLANAGTVNIAGGTLALGSNSDTVGIVNLSSGSITGSGTLTGSAYNLTDTGNISANLGGSVALTKSGAGTATLSGANTYSGGTTISAGTLGLGSATALGSGAVTMSGGNLDNTSGSALTLTTNNTHNWSNAFTFVGSNDLTLGTGTVNITTNREITVSAGTLALGATSWTNGGSYNFLKSGAGTLKLSGAASSFSFVNHAVSAGTLELASGYSSDALGIFAGYDFISGPTANNATLLISGGQATPFGAYIGGGTTQDVSAANESGVINLTSGSLQTGIVAIRNGEFNMTGGSGYGRLFIGTLNGQSGAATISGGTWISRTNGVGTGEDGSAIVGSGTGTGTLTLGDGGILQTDSISLESATSTLNFGAGGTSGTTTATVFNAYNGGTINFNHTGTLSISARIESSGAYNHLGSGTTTLSGDIAGHYTSPGAVSISAGTLKVTSGDALQDRAVVTLSNVAGATLTLDGANETIGALAGGGTTGGNVSLGSNTLTLGLPSVGTHDFAGEISGTGSIIKAGPTTQIFSGTNTYTGGTTVSGGSLQIGNGGTTGSLVGNITNNANVTFNRSDDVTFAGIISGSGSLTKSGAGTTTLTGTNTFSGGTTISAGTLQIGNGGTTGSLAGNITNNANVTFNRSNDLTFGGNISGSGTLTKEANNVLTLSGTNTYAGDTFVNDGTLRMGSANALSPNTTLRVAPGATFNPNGFAQTVANLGGTGDIDVGTGGLNVNPTGTNTFAGRLTGTGGLTKGGTGTLELSGAHTFSGPTAINSGRLRLTGSAANSAFAINNGGTLSGTGTLGSLTVNTGGILSPGNSPGTLSAGNTVWAGDASFIFEIDNATGTQGTNWDLLAITGTLSVNATMANPFTINVDTLLNGTDTAGTMSNFDANTSDSWTFVTTTGGISFGTNASVGASFAINTDDFANTTNGTFSIAHVGDNLALNYTASAVPEPDTFALLFGAFALAFSGGRRRVVRRPVRHSFSEGGTS